MMQWRGDVSQSKNLSQGRRANKLWENPVQTGFWSDRRQSFPIYAKPSPSQRNFRHAGLSLTMFCFLATWANRHLLGRVTRPRIACWRLTHILLDAVCQMFNAGDLAQLCWSEQVEIPCPTSLFSFLRQFDQFLGV
jgi:hypothetical protein